MEQKGFKILLAYDGSELALNAVRYISESFPSDSFTVVLFYVETKIPRSFWHMEKELDFRFKTPDIRASMAVRIKTVNQFMAQAKKILLEKGFPDTAVKIKIHTKNQSIVQDIVEESRSGYDAVVIGRRGSSLLKDILVGSVPKHLLGRIYNIPLIVVGGSMPYKNILVAYDGTREIIRAVKKMSLLFKRTSGHLLFCHAHRASGFVGKTSINDVTSFFSQSKVVLTDAGFDEAQIDYEIIKTSKNPAVTLLERARQGNFGTIIIGRRGLSLWKQFLKGRVGNRIFQYADDCVVWVVQ